MEFDPFWKVEYDYDTLNRRVARAESTMTVDGGEGGGGTTTTNTEMYIYDDCHVVFDFEKPAHYSEDAYLKRRYPYGNAVDQIVAN